MTEKQAAPPEPRPRQRGKATAKDIDRAALDRQAIAMRRKGATFDEIAAALGMSNKSVAYKSVKRGLQNFADGDVEELRARELARTDELFARLEPLIASDPPDLAAVDRVIKLLDYRAKICGLYAPRKHQVGVQLEATIDLRALDAVELLRNHIDLGEVIDATLNRPPTELEPGNDNEAGDDD